MIIASPDLIQQCQMPKQTCTSVKIKLGAVKDISCTNSGDYCLIAAANGIFELHTVGGLTANKLAVPGMPYSG